jgi:hypothetical protein
MESPPLRVLSLDGGGVRGAYTATYLDRVADAFAKRRGETALDIGASFDVIAGTSTGAIIGCALAAPVPLSKVVELYTTQSASIFRRPLPQGALGVLPDNIRRPTALSEGNTALRSALHDVLGGVTMGEVYKRRGIALAIPAVEMGQHHAWVFKTPHLKDTNHRDDNYSLVDVCLATSAAPIYRSMAAIDHPNQGAKGYNVFVDGGLWANNPVLVGLIDALDMAAPEQAIEVYCLGTCPIPSGEQIARADVSRNLLDWKFGGEAAGLAIDAQQFAYDHMAKKLARHVGRDCKIIRFPSDKVPASLVPYLGLDDTRPEAIAALINQARNDANMTNSRCGYRETDPEAALICRLFEALPALTNPPMKRMVPLANGPK